MRSTVVRSVLVCGVLLAGCTGSTPPPVFDETAWRADLDLWREDYERRLRADYGWLSLVGLDWLEPGTAVIGSAADADVRLPERAAPPRVASVELSDDGRIRLVPDPASGLTIDGEPATERRIDPDVDELSDVYQVGELRFRLIVRGDRIGIRSRWPQAETRTAFSGVEWYEPTPGARIVGRLDRSAATNEITVPNVLGDELAQWSPGRVHFEIDGHTVSLAPVADDENDRTLFFVFRDRTAGETTYPAGRFLYGTLADDDSVVLDFNRAYNPPCAWTPFATCPLPPKGNALDVAIAAGERYTGHH